MRQPSGKEWLDAMRAKHGIDYGVPDSHNDVHAPGCWGINDTFACDSMDGFVSGDCNNRQRKGYTQPNVDHTDHFKVLAIKMAQGKKRSTIEKRLRREYKIGIVVLTRLIPMHLINGVYIDINDLPS